MIFDLSETPGSEADDVVVPELSDGVLQELFSAAQTVLKLEPWKRLCDTDWFGIRDPESGETHIVAVMGASREFFAVNVYLPEEGVRFWNDFIRTGQPNQELGMRAMRMVSCEFISWNEEDADETDLERNDLYGDDDLEVDDLDSFLFRSTLPGCVNWHPDEAEAIKILDGLRLLPGFLKQSGKFPGFNFYGSTPEIPVFELKENGDRANPVDWEIKVERFPEAAPQPEFLPDELFAARLAAHKIKKNETWEIGSIHLPTPVVSEGRPRWLTATIVVSVNSGMVFGTELGHSAAPREIALRKAFLASVMQTGSLPETLRVRSEIAVETFQDLPGMTVRFQKVLEMFNEVSKSLLEAYEPGRESQQPEGISPENFEKLQEILNQYPHPHEMSPTEIAAMMYKIKAIEGADEVLGMAVEMSEGTSPPPAPPSKDRYIFRIELENFGPPIWRRLSIGADSTFSDLHSAIQALFDWDGWHCHCFQIRKGRSIVSSIGSDELDDLPEWETPLSEIFKRKGSKIHYVYDFGDNWTHLITQEGKVPAKKGETGPICLGGERIGPPEDCGGIRGFDQLLDPENDKADDDEGYDPEFLKHLREGKFSPEDVKF